MCLTYHFIHYIVLAVTLSYNAAVITSTISAANLKGNIEITHFSPYIYLTITVLFLNFSTLHADQTFIP